jgi:hypothetical protein
VAHKSSISSQRRQQTVQDTSWRAAGQAGSQSAAHFLAWTTDDFPEDRDQSQWISVPGQQALAQKLLLTGTGFAVLMPHYPIWLAAVGFLSFPDFRLSITAYIGSFI